MTHQHSTPIQQSHYRKKIQINHILRKRRFFSFSFLLLSSTKNSQLDELCIYIYDMITKYFSDDIKNRLLNVQTHTHVSGQTVDR